MILLALLISFVDRAPAYEVSGYSWEVEDLPLAWSLDDTEEDSLPDGYPQEVIQRSFESWESAAVCSPISDEWQAGGESAAVRFYWDDPGDDLAAGVYALIVYQGGGGGSWGGDTLRLNVIFADGVDWATTEEVEDGTCADQPAIEAVVVHELGHVWGLADSCDADECSGDAAAAAMASSGVGELCDVSRILPNADDAAGIRAMYGPTLVVDGGSAGDVTQRIGAVPWEACFTAEFVGSDGDAGVVAVSEHWVFGDGAESDAMEPCHTYTEEGEYTVSVTVIASGGACGEWGDYEVSLGTVTACELPHPEEGADGLFEMVQVEGLRWSTINHTDVTTYGCVDTIEWQVYEGTGEADIVDENRVEFNGSAGEAMGAWSPVIDFPAAGDYVVVMNLGGPGGVAAAFLALRAEDGAKAGCSSLPGRGAGWGMVAMAALATAIRRGGRAPGTSRG